jgi:hypothetical protein
MLIHLFDEHGDSNRYEIPVFNYLCYQIDYFGRKLNQKRWTCT